MPDMVLQSVYGSKPVVEDVYAFDAFRQSVFVRFAAKGSDLARPACVQLVELEAWDAAGCPVEPQEAVLSMVAKSEIFN